MSLSESLKFKKNNAPHLIVKALAGTGKTITLVEGLKVIKGHNSYFTPSMQQKKIWDAMYLSKDATSICSVAFTKSIATELHKRVPDGCDAMTLHSLGRRAVVDAYGELQMDNKRIEKILMDITGYHDVWEFRRKKGPTARIMEKLVSLCKVNLIYQCTESTGVGDVDELDRLAAHYDVDLNGSRAEVFTLVPEVLERCKDLEAYPSLNFDDMVWLPVVLDLPVKRYDLLLVDECQDLNRCQQALAKKSGSRLILVGDEKQAIYGFAGADAESMQRMEQELSQQVVRAVIDARTPEICGLADGLQLDQTRIPHDTGDPENLCRCMVEGRGCQVLPLTVTRRCGRAIVKEAQKIVPAFEAHKNCCFGLILNAPIEKTKKQDSYRFSAKEGDMILCRVNAPLVSECFKFLKDERKATIRGRDVAQALESTIHKQNASDIVDLAAKLSDWVILEVDKEQHKCNSSNARVIALQDRYNCLCCFLENATNIQEVIGKIEKIFSDKNEEGITLSSIHKAKGLEAKRVFLLEPEGATVPHPMAKSKWQIKQEWNLRYVAITRAIEELVFVS